MYQNPKQEDMLGEIPVVGLQQLVVLELLDRLRLQQLVVLDLLDRLLQLLNLHTTKSITSSTTARTVIGTVSFGFTIVGSTNKDVGLATYYVVFLV
jgi:hypothetical protein